MTTAHGAYIDSGGTGRSWPKATSALCGVVAILLGLLVIVGWLIHTTLPIQLAPDLPPMQRGSAIGVALCGLALLGIVLARPRWTLASAAIPGILGGLSFVEYLSHLHLPSDAITGRMSPATALCFILLACGFWLAHWGPPYRRSMALGISGVLVAAIGVACWISVIWADGSAFGLGRVARMALPTATSFLLLGLGAAVIAIDMSENQLRLPVWAPFGATLF